MRAVSATRRDPPRKRGPRSEMQMRIKEKRETLVVEMYVSGGKG